MGKQNVQAKKVYFIDPYDQDRQKSGKNARHTRMRETWRKRDMASAVG